MGEQSDVQFVQRGGIAGFAVYVGGVTTCGGADALARFGVGGFPGFARKKRRREHAVPSHWQTWAQPDIPRGLKPSAHFCRFSARLKSCPDTKRPGILASEGFFCNL